MSRSQKMQSRIARKSRDCQLLIEIELRAFTAGGILKRQEPTQDRGQAQTMRRLS